MRLLLAGNFAAGHVGQGLQDAAGILHIDLRLADLRQASAAPRWWVALNWHLLGHRPPALRRYSQAVLDLCRQFQPTFLLSTGLAPISAPVLERIRRLGIRRLNFSTDDPWNPSHRAGWFFDALPHYDIVFSPRRSNLEQLREVGCRHVQYLPFGYDPQHWYPEAITQEERRRLECDVLFVGGADRDRVPILTALADEGFDVAAYGGYWQRYAETRAFARGRADPETVRKATRAARVALCLVRRANRDGHVMRSMEIPAIGACMLVEDTEEHREIFGAEREAVLYFDTRSALVTKVRWLLEHPDVREQLACAAYERITRGRNTYRHRLETMLDVASSQL